MPMPNSGVPRVVWPASIRRRLAQRNSTLTAGSALLVTCCLLAACSGASSPATTATGGERLKGGVATVGIISTNMPNYILPFASSAYTVYPDPYVFWNLMYRPLYWEGSGTSAGVNYALSLADPPQWSDHNQVVSVHLKNYAWSNGTKLTPRNVAFFMGLDFSEKTNYGLYTPGYFPDDVSGVDYDNAANTVTFHLTHPVAPLWFVDNQLTQIYPFPVAWDRTAGGPANCSSENAAAELKSCPAVYSYLTDQAKSLSTYGTNPIWQIVDGPWRLKSFQPGGDVTFVPNPSYSGPIKPTLSAVRYVPFTSDTAEYNEVRGSTTLTVATNIPLADLPQANANLQPSSQPLAPNYTISPLYPFGVDYAFTNYNNPVYGPVFKQLYFRQALQSTVDQPVYIRVAYRGYGVPTYGPVPLLPPNPYVDATEKTNLYPFSITAARRYLTANGWTIPSSGPAVCSRPGSGSGQCGAGISAGTKLAFTLGYPTGFLSVNEVVQQWASDASKAGIDLSLRPESFTAAVGQLTTCSTTTSKPCGWDFLNFLGADNDGIYPGGDLLFGSNGSMNYGDFSSPAMDKLILPTVETPSVAAILKLEDYGARQLPYPWMPLEAFFFFAIAHNLRGFLPSNVNAYENPEDWYFVK
jgi:peptide/nickel transport system substrate-binding protein